MGRITYHPQIKQVCKVNVCNDVVDCIERQFRSHKKNITLYNFAPLSFFGMLGVPCGTPAYVIGGAFLLALLGCGGSEPSLDTEIERYLKSYDSPYKELSDSEIRELSEDLRQILIDRLKL